MGGHGDINWVKPDWRQYQVKNSKAAQAHVARLAKLGLKDPWVIFKPLLNIVMFILLDTKPCLD